LAPLLRSLTWALVALADVLRAQGDDAAALGRAREALEIGERVQSPSGSSSCREVLGRLAASRGRVGS
jgi:hypothetical protein